MSPARLSKYSAAVSDAFCAAELIVISSIDFHTSNICRSTTFHIKSIRCAARRAFLFAQTNDEWQAEPIRFFGASALFRISSASFLPILFWQDRKEWAAGGTTRHSGAEKIWPAERRMRLRKPHRASGGIRRNKNEKTAHPCRQKRKEKKK